MIYTDFQGERLSLLGLGTMRLPTADGKIDEAQTAQMIETAFQNGVNYVDTAWPYHGGHSETVVGRLLKKYPRDSFNLADKYPGHQIFEKYEPAVTFEEQLRKCGVDYFDFYLLHNVCEMSLPVYTDPRWGIVDYFAEQKRLGRIRHLGISTHAGVDCLKDILDRYGDVIEFCQIQLNYLDWTLQNAKAKYDLLTERGIPVWVMEPVRGGQLAKLSESAMHRLSAFRPEAAAPEWALRWLQSLPNVQMVLTGASNMEQLTQNLAAFRQREAATAEETAALYEIAENLKNSIPCTGCRYCVDSCPMGLDIPLLLSLSNEERYAYSLNIGIRVDALGEGKRPSDCLSCGACTHMCPQKIDIPSEMKRFAGALTQHPSWAQLCREREEAARKLKEGK